jgi:hypothetical protein
VIRALVGLGAAYVRRAVCAVRGHRFDEQVPSPAGMVYCSRCRGRYPVEETDA